MEGGGGEGDYIYLSLHSHHWNDPCIKRLYIPTLHCHHQNDPCIKMGRHESHFNVSLTVRDKVTSQRPQTTTFLKRGEKGNQQIQKSNKFGYGRLSGTIRSCMFLQTHHLALATTGQKSNQQTQESNKFGYQRLTGTPTFQQPHHQALRPRDKRATSKHKCQTSLVTKG